MAAARNPAPAGAVDAVVFDGVTKRFGPTLANDAVTFAVRAGSIHGIVGENGAGKSTLVNLLYGVHRPDGGRIRVEGRPVQCRRPREAIAAGLGLIHQHLSLVPALTGVENVILGHEPRRPWGIDWAVAVRRVRDLAGAHGLSVALDVPAGALDLAGQQRVELLKALYRNARILLLDEPSTLMAPAEYAEFARSLRGFVAAGGTILYVSHRLPEVLDLCDCVTVLRGGRVVTTEAAAGLDAARLAQLMVGEAMPAPVRPRVRRVAPDVPPVLALHDVTTVRRRGDARLHGVSLDVRHGEILGVAGVGGNGQRTLARVLVGLERPLRGRVRWQGAQVWNRVGLRARRRAGLGWIPADRTRAGVVAGLSLGDNLVLGRHGSPPFATAGIRRRRAVRAAAAGPLADLRVQPPAPDAPAGPLSGGNQQKLLVARELDGAPRLLVAEHPTRGVDVATAARIHARVRALRDGGTAVVLIAADLDELLRVADRVAVMYAGRVLGTFPAGEVTAADLAPLLGGIAEHVGRGAAS